MANVSPIAAYRCRRLYYYAVSGAILLIIFTVYAPSLRLTTLFDDAYNILHIGDRSVLSLFDLRPYGTLNYRPMSFVPWVLVRDWFGWFRPEMLHYLNVAVHVLNTALVASLAWRLGRAWRLPGSAFPALAGLCFGLFPFSYQAVLWAGALPHPLMTVFGLGGVHAYLTAEYRVGRSRVVLLALSGLLLLGACLSHEQGFVFGFLVLLVEGVLALCQRRRLRVAAFALASLMLAYAMFVKLFVQTLWTDPNATMLATSPSDWLTSIAYDAQGMLVWLLILGRNIIGLPEQKVPLLLGLFIINLLSVAIFLLKFKRLTLGLISFAWWGVAIAPSVLLLSQSYILSGPRLMYAASIGIALLYAGSVALLLSHTRSVALKGVLLALVVFLGVWCVPYIEERTTITAHLTDSLKFIDRDLRTSAPESKVLLIDLPGWVGTNNPSFLLGSEGMLFFQDSMAPPSTLIASVGNTQRDTVHVRDMTSPAYSDHYVYGLAGPMEDEATLKAQVLKANYIYRFYFDEPGLRSERLAILAPLQNPSDPLGQFSRGNAGAVLERANATDCTDRIVLDMTWNGVTAIPEPVAVFVHGMDASGQQVIVADRDPVGGLLPLNEIPAGLQVNERRVITATTSMPVVSQVQVGIYSRTDGQRYEAARADGSLWDGAGVTIPVKPDIGGAVCHP